MSSPPAKPAAPTLFSQTTSAYTLLYIGTLCKIFTYAFNRQRVHGIDSFLQLLDSRWVSKDRERGLITVSNHVSIIDDPLMWAFLPYKFLSKPDSMRWSLGSYDLCFKHELLGKFFFAGRVLPTHRLLHSPLGGPFQPTMREVIRLLSDPPLPRPTAYPTNDAHNLSSAAVPNSDPFSSPTAVPNTYTTNGLDRWPSPSAFQLNRYSWIHVFPEGRVHQHPQKTMRYFRWGVARMILEADECPDIIPMWIEGYDQVYPEDRGFPRPVPRVGNRLNIWIGENVGGATPANPFLDLRARWQALVRRKTTDMGLPEPELGTLPESLQHGDEAVELRIECTNMVRNAVLDLRRKRGLSDEDPEAGLVETWREEGMGKEIGKKKGW